MDYELAFWIVLAILAGIGLVRFLSKSYKEPGRMSDYWIDRYIHGKK